MIYMVRRPVLLKNYNKLSEIQTAQTAGHGKESLEESE
jgi:hypothetical protein